MSQPPLGSSSDNRLLLLHFLMPFERVGCRWMLFCDPIDTQKCLNFLLFPATQLRLRSYAYAVMLLTKHYSGSIMNHKLLRRWFFPLVYGPDSFMSQSYMRRLIVDLY